MARRFVPLALSLSLLACSSSSSSGPSGSSDAGLAGDSSQPAADASDASTFDVDPQTRAAAKSACDGMAQALCARLSACYPTMLALEYGDMATCVTRSSLACVPTLLAPGSLTTTKMVGDCASVLSTADCPSLFYNRAPPAFCRTFPGSNQNGASCVVGAQCTSGVCLHGANGCGTCVVRAEQSQPCTVSEQCDNNLYCQGTICDGPGSIGAHCDATHACGSGYRCANGTCQTPSAAGDTCTPGATPLDSACDASAGLWCDPSSKTCKPWNTVASGACGVVSGTFTLCSSSGVCPNPSGSSTCVPAAKDGDARSASTPCMPPAQCIGGKCTVMTESSCL